LASQLKQVTKVIRQLHKSLHRHHIKFGKERLKWLVMCVEYS